MKGNVRFIVQVMRCDNNVKRRRAEKIGTIFFDTLGDAQRIERQINRNDSGIEARITVRLHAYDTVIDTTPYAWEMLQLEINQVFSDLRNTINSDNRELMAASVDD